MFESLKKLASGALLVAAALSRFYTYIYANETAGNRQTRNMMLTNAFSAHRMVSQYPNESNFSLVAVPAVSMITTAYSLYRSGHANGLVAPVAQAVLPPAMPAPVVGIELNSHESRLEAIHFDEADIPQRYIDQISMCVMDNPVRAKTTIRNSQDEPIDTYHYYDRATYDSLNGTCPTNRQPFIEVTEDNDLKTEIQQFVVRCEAQYQPLNAQLVEAPRRLVA